MKQVAIKATRLIDNKEVVEEIILQFKTEASECTLLDWSTLEMALQKQPAFTKESGAEWTDAQWIEYRNFLIECLSIFLVDKQDAFLNLQQVPLEDGSVDSLSALFDLIMSEVRSFKPEKRLPNKPFYFTHNGRTFSIPPTYENAFENITQIAPQTTFREASEALMADLRFSQKDDGKDMFEHAKYQTSLWLLAAMCREQKVRKKDGRILGMESVPSDTQEWHDLIMARLEFFKDVSLETGLQVNFFLSNSKPTSQTTVTMHIFTILRHTIQTLNPARQKRSSVG